MTTATARKIVPTRAGLVLAIVDFEARYGSVVRNALELQAKHMREAADSCVPPAEPGPAPEPEPGTVPVTGTIDITPPPSGLLRIAGAFRESADRADEALAALEAIFELAEALGERI